MIHSTSVDAMCSLPTSLSINSGLNITGDYEPMQQKFLVRHAPKFVFDVTHDNEPINSKDSKHGKGNVLATAALGCACEGVAFGSTWGNDIGIEKHIRVTNQTPCYPKFTEFEMTNIRAKLLQLRETLIDYPRVYAHNHGEYLTVERTNPDTYESILFIIVPDFRKYVNAKVNLSLDGVFTQVEFFSQLSEK